MAFEGHTDERGSREYNLALGKNELGSTQCLRFLDVADDQLDSIRFSKEILLAQGAAESSLAKNR